MNFATATNGTTADDPMHTVVFSNDS